MGRAVSKDVFDRGSITITGEGETEDGFVSLDFFLQFVVPFQYEFKSKKKQKVEGGSAGSKKGGVDKSIAYAKNVKKSGKTQASSPLKTVTVVEEEDEVSPLSSPVVAVVKSKGATAANIGGKADKKAKVAFVSSDKQTQTQTPKSENISSTESSPVSPIITKSKKKSPVGNSKLVSLININRSRKSV